MFDQEEGFRIWEQLMWSLEALFKDVMGARRLNRLSVARSPDAIGCPNIGAGKWDEEMMALMSITSLRAVDFAWQLDGRSSEVDD